MSTFDPIDDALDIEVSREPQTHDLVEVEKEEVGVGSTAKGDADKDYEYTRGQLYNLIEKGQEAVTNALDLANEGDSARAYEVVGGLIKNVADTADKLLDLQKKVKELDNVSVTNNQTNVTNNSVFVGSTTELQKLIKEGMINKISDSDRS